MSEDHQWLVTAPYGNRRDVPRGRPVPPGLSTGVQQHLLLRGQRTFLSGNNGVRVDVYGCVSFCENSKKKNIFFFFLGGGGGGRDGGGGSGWMGMEN